MSNSNSWKAPDLLHPDRSLNFSRDKTAAADTSGESHRNRWSNLFSIGAGDEIKFVIADRTDYAWARDAIAERHLAARTPHLLMSAVFGKLAPRQLVEWVLEDRLPVRVQLQMHKYVWSPDATGV